MPGNSNKNASGNSCFKYDWPWSNVLRGPQLHAPLWYLSWDGCLHPAASIWHRHRDAGSCWQSIRLWSGRFKERSFGKLKLGKVKEVSVNRETVWPTHIQCWTSFKNLSRAQIQFSMRSHQFSKRISQFSIRSIISDLKNRYLFQSSRYRHYTVDTSCIFLEHFSHRSHQ